jgi:putative membrane protein
MWHMQDVGWGWWFITTIGMVAFWALVIYGLIMLARGGSREAAVRESPEDLLKRRLASGEITVEEYERLCRALATPSARDHAPAAST